MTVDSVLNYLVENLISQDIPAEVSQEGLLILPSLECSVRVNLVEGNLHPNMIVIRFLTEHSIFSMPIEDQVVGIGMTLDKQIENVVRTWHFGFLVPLHLFLHVSDQAMPMITLASDGSEPLAWQIYTVPPLMSVSEADEQPASPERMELLQHLVQPLCKNLRDRKPHFLKCFVMKHSGAVSSPGDKLDASCHFDNEEWWEGLSELLYLGDTWGELEMPRMRRQWAFFKPVTPEDLGSDYHKILESMGFKAKPKWKFW